MGARRIVRSILVVSLLTAAALPATAEEGTKLAPPFAGSAATHSCNTLVLAGCAGDADARPVTGRLVTETSLRADRVPFTNVSAAGYGYSESVALLTLTDQLDQTIERATYRISVRVRAAGAGVTPVPVGPSSYAQTVISATAFHPGCDYYCHAGASRLLAYASGGVSEGSAPGTTHTLEFRLEDDFEGEPLPAGGVEITIEMRSIASLGSLLPGSGAEAYGDVVVTDVTRL